MTIRARLEDALCLWQADRREGAWIQVLIAAAGTARLRYPRAAFGDQDAFTRFIREVAPTITDPALPALPPPGIEIILRKDTGTPIGLHDVVHVHMRCHLLHEGTLDPSVRLSRSRLVAGRLEADFRPGAVMEFPDHWVWHLARAVQDAPENAALFAKGKLFAAP
jgi:hypothetical protein